MSNRESRSASRWSVRRTLARYEEAWNAGADEPGEGPLGGWPLAATVAGLFVILVWIVMIGWLGLRLLLWLFGE